MIRPFGYIYCPSLLQVQDTGSWPLIDPLPSYGRGRELPGGRYMSFIHGDGLQDVIITGALHLLFLRLLYQRFSFKFQVVSCIPSLHHCI